MDLTVRNAPLSVMRDSAGAPALGFPVQPCDYSVAVLICGGTSVEIQPLTTRCRSSGVGVTPYISVLMDLHNKSKIPGAPRSDVVFSLCHCVGALGPSLKAVIFVWVVKEPLCLNWFAPEIARCTATCNGVVIYDNACSIRGDLRYRADSKASRRSTVACHNLI